ADLLVVFLVILVASIGGGRLFGDADAATHVATGSWILDHRQIPRVDPFSGTHAGAEWFAHEWLADLGSALLYRACGWNGLVAAGIVAAACTLLNPWGWRLPAHLISFFTIHGPALKATTEFAPAAADDRAGLALFIFTGLCIAGVVCGLRGAERPGRGPTG